jgi:diaminopimelate dehydrogenase
MSIKVGIVGYGNIGKGVEKIIRQNPDMELAAVFERSDFEGTETKTEGVRICPSEMMDEFAGKIDVMIICCGSAKDAPVLTPRFAELFNTVDSYDTHAKIPEYLETVNQAALRGGKAAIVSTGWDPGLFSIMSALFDAVLPEGSTNKFWGHGVSQGHSEAIRRVEGVKGAVQYTIPVQQAIELARAGEENIPVWERHVRECFVVPEPGADLERIKDEIVNMPHYFAGYQTIVHFVTEEELIDNHYVMPHAGHVIRLGETKGHRQLMEFSLNLENNPEFTASVLAAYARAAVRLHREGNFGAKTVLDVPVSYLSPKVREDLVKEFL